MPAARRKALPRIFVVVLACFVVVSGPVGASAVEVHDVARVTPPGQEVKCGCSTCGNPCGVQPPPPPPPSPPPPPKGPSVFCPPPPAPRMYFMGPPADLYPVDQGFPSAGRRGRAPSGLPVLLGCGLWGLLGIWWL